MSGQRNKPAVSMAEIRPELERLHRRGFLRGALSLGALTMLTGCDLSTHSGVDAALEAILRFDDRAQDERFRRNYRSSFSRLYSVPGRPGPTLVVFHTLLTSSPTAPIVAMPTVVALRPVSSDARVGEHSAVVWNWDRRTPRSAIRLIVGISTSPPKQSHVAMPVSSQTM